MGIETSAESGCHAVPRGEHRKVPNQGSGAAFYIVRHLDYATHTQGAEEIVVTGNDHGIRVDSRSHDDGVRRPSVAQQNAQQNQAVYIECPLHNDRNFYSRLTVVYISPPLSSLP